MAVTFDSIGNGELAGMFKTALAQIGRNILDPNMDPEAARGMTINIKFKPNTSGTILTSYDVKTKLAGQKKAETTLLIGQDAGTGRMEISEYNNNRPQIQGYDAVPAKPFDPETGEIYDGGTGGPIDLRRAAVQ